ncbi:MAG: hypothetical protein WBP93_03985 [Pyrinomonadaceae bacterium]
MRVDVIVIVEETLESIMNWQLKPDDKGRLCALRTTRDNQSIQTPARAWGELTRQINRRALGGNHNPVEIFLYLRDGLRDSIEEYDVLKGIVADGRNHALGGKLYVVWDDRALELSFYELDALNMLVKCFRGLLRERVTDVIEITRGETPLGELSFNEQKKIIRGRADTSQKRQETLKGFVSKDGWSYGLRNESRMLESLLSEFVKDGYLPSTSPNNLIIFDASPEFGVEELLGEFGKGPQNLKRVVATTLESYSAILKYQRQSEAPPIEVTLFKGTLEMVYALLLLNDAGKSEVRREDADSDKTIEQESIQSSTPVEIKYVKLSPHLIFGPASEESPLRLLITSAFEGSKMLHSRSEAEEIGALLRELSFRTEVEKHLYIDCESFGSLLESKSFTAWIHLSHGDEDGMYDSQLKMCLPPERWLNCFKAYGRRSLKLALFSVCQSAPTAKLFAKAGVEVAIGFKKDVHTDATTILAQKVVSAAMQVGSNQEVVLKAFAEACESLASRTFNEGVSYLDVKPVAYRSTRT